MKKGSLILAIIGICTLIIIGGCSKNEPTPNDRFESYVDYWNDLAFEKMYNLHAESSQETYKPEEAVDRFKKIYEDLGISNVQISYDQIEEDKLKEVWEEGTATIPFSVEMDSIAGPISFNYDANLLLQEEGEEEGKDWFVDWDPGFIFPQIKDGGEIGLQTTNPKRGEILDRNRMPLAINDVVYEIGVVPERFVSENQEKKQIAKELHISVEAIDDALSAGWVEPNLFVPLKKVPKDKVSAALWNIPSVEKKEVTGRTYPSGEAAAHLVGYVGPITAEELEEQEPGTYGANDMIGKRGLEQLFEDRLKGEQGVTITVKSSEEETVLAEKEVQDGENIHLTIDTIAQEKLFDAYDGKAGTAAAIHPKTGETLALVSSPAFDPNEIVYEASTDLWNQLENDEQKPLINRFSATFAPGSVIKPITAAIGMQQETLDPKEGLKINGLTWSKKGWGDYKVKRVSSTDKPVDLENAMIRSDNIYFAMQAVKMGSKNYVSGLKEFGLDEEIPFEYPISNSTISSNGKLEDELMLANTSYGQGQIEFSSLHLALTYTPFLNNGNLLKPTLLLDDKDKQIWKEDILDENHATLMTDLLRKVVTDGTAQVAKNADFPISGKTGTAELKTTSEEKGKENGWFIGFPSEDQDILIAMMIEDVKDIGASKYVAEQVTEVLKQLK
ncbi:penicillin-binding transpeptidase domain-containing protein [Virgibacillus sp. W0181]|uniref:penicillin-binding transpeptidase domain-containing protein n=1 Tax=Virgibacillus sp. W0181 TaxID=3391581 RepID=UPI003F485483